MYRVYPLNPRYRLLLRVTAVPFGMSVHWLYCVHRLLRDTLASFLASFFGGLGTIEKRSVYHSIKTSEYNFNLSHGVK